MIKYVKANKGGIVGLDKVITENLTAQDVDFLADGIYDAYTDLLLAIQDKYGIRYGDCDPGLAFDLDEATVTLVQKMVDILECQLWNNGLVDED